MVRTSRSHRAYNPSVFSSSRQGVAFDKAVNKKAKKKMSTALPRGDVANV